MRLAWRGDSEHQARIRGGGGGTKGSGTPDSLQPCLYLPAARFSGISALHRQRTGNPRTHLVPSPGPGTDSPAAVGGSVLSGLPAPPGSLRKHLWGLRWGSTGSNCGQSTSGWAVAAFSCWSQETSQGILPSWEKTRLWSQTLCSLRAGSVNSCSRTTESWENLQSGNRKWTQW